MGAMDAVTKFLDFEFQYYIAARFALRADPRPSPVICSIMR
jgi:hypothetical protein